MGRIILDTHAFLWWVADAPELSATARDAITEAGLAYVSVATVWELAIKVGNGKLKLARDVGEFVTAHTEANDFRVLPIELRHAARVQHLEAHHRDPFDRLLVAQSQEDRLTLVSNEALFDAYGVARVW